MRRVLAVIEALAAAVTLLVAYEFMTSPRIGGDGIFTSVARELGPLLIVMSAGLAWTAVTAWRGGRHWWAWQVAAPVWIVVLLIAPLLWSLVRS